MGTLSSGVGLISGLDIQSIVGQLMEIESRPRNLLTDRIEGITNRQTGLVTLQAQVLAVRLSAINFRNDAVFQQKTSSSSDEDSLTATTTRFSQSGSYSFEVKRLASSHQLISRAYSNRNSSIGKGVVSFEVGNGQLARATSLSTLNGGQGITRGTLEITDRNGNEAAIDLSAALTMQDVVDAVNGEQGLGVSARVSGDHLVLEDTTGGAGQFIVRGEPAASLGIETDVSGVAENRIVGQDLVSITTDTLLSTLNDGNGVNLRENLVFRKGDETDPRLDVDFRSTMFEVAGDPAQSTRLAALNGGGGVELGTIRITDTVGRSVEIDLTTLGENATMAQLRDLVEAEASAAGLEIRFSFNSRDSISVTDNSAAEPDDRTNFIIEDLNGGRAAEDLGIATGPEGVESTFVGGDQIYSMETLGDLLNAINNHYDNNGQFAASIADDGLSLVITDLTGQTGALSLTGQSAQDLRIYTDGTTAGTVQGRRLVAGLNTVLLRSLNGGSGADEGRRIAPGEALEITNRSGAAVRFNDEDFQSIETVQDFIDLINLRGQSRGIQASLSTAGNGIVVTDTSGGSGNLTIQGDLADKLGIAVEDAVHSVESGNLQLQYVSEATRLEDLRQGRGISNGRFEVTNSQGESFEVNISDSTETIADVIDAINVAGGSRGITARINSDGDGILIEDTSGGDGVLTITDLDGGSAASDLRLAGTAQSGTTSIDGSYELKLDIGGGDSLDDIVSRINGENFGFQAAVLFDGDGYRLSLTSEITGEAGTIYLDGGETSLSATTLRKGQDALLLQDSLLIRSSSNSIQDVVKGTTLELTGISKGEVTITIGNDLEGVTAQIQSFVESYNEVMDQIDELTSFNPETLETGLLFGDATVSSVKRNLQQLVQRVFVGAGEFTRLSQIGIGFARLVTETGTDANGNQQQFAVAQTPRLTFDESAFQEALGEDQENLEKIAELFTAEGVGLGDVLDEQLNRLAAQSDSTIQNQVESLDNQKELFESRVSDLDILLANRETQLFNQFIAMEQALANLQTQQNALASLSNAAASASVV